VSKAHHPLVPHAPEALVRRVPVVRATPAPHLKAYTTYTYSSTNNRRDPTPGTGHKETTTADNSDQTAVINGETGARQWHTDGAMAIDGKTEGDEGQKKKVKTDGNDNIRQ
jgi:hypothetical protein